LNHRPHQSGHIVGLDLIRFGAAFLVMSFHLGYVIWAGDSFKTPVRAAGLAIRFEELAFFNVGHIGVDIFFVISGFIIAYSAENSSAYEFLRSRIVRLVPAVWIIAPVTLAVAAAIGFSSTTDLCLRFVRSIVFFPFGPWIDGVYWTLPIEISFYGIVFGLLAARRFSWIVPTMAVVGVCSSAFWIASAFGATGPHWDRPLDLLLVHHGCFFALGVFLWLSLLKRLTIGRLGMIACFCVGCFLSIHEIKPCLIWATSVLGIIVSVRVNSKLASRKELASVIRLLGLTTYPLYLLHQLVGAAAIGWLFRHGFEKHFAVLTSAILVMVGSFVIATAIEPRLQVWLKGQMDRRSISLRLFLLQRRKAATAIS
jgi:peptidoglycan/LPS O-acetylase OafA/YrhL